ncbi:MAG: hypothetical protein C4319_04685 [Acidimicrobiia bacterium]
MSRYLAYLYDALSRDLAGGNLLGAVYGVLVRLVGGALAGLYAVCRSYALAIALLTVAVRAALYPLTAKQVKAMAAMQKLQPELMRLRQKYKDDRVRLNEEVMGLYQRHGVNPLGGCLPLLVQAPIMFVIWSAIGVAWGAAPTHRFAGAVTDFCTNEVGQPSQCAPGTAFLPPWSSLFEAIQHHRVSLLGIDLTRPGSGQRGVAFFLFLLLVGLVTATQWYQQRQMQKSSDVEINPQAQAVQQVLPIVFGFITYTLAAGLGIYFLVGNLIQIGQQRLLLRHREEAAAKIDQSLKQVSTKNRSHVESSEARLSNGAKGRDSNRTSNATGYRAGSSTLRQQANSEERRVVAEAAGAGRRPKKRRRKR